jgi:hypothetical protein
MFRKVLLPALVAAVALSAFSTDAFAQKGPDGPKRPASKTPMEYFSIYSMTGATLSYTGWQYCDYARQIALVNGYGDSSTKGSFAKGQEYAYQSFYYGYYGYSYGYKDWIVNAGDMAVASRNYEQGIYNYLYGSYQRNPKQLQTIMDVIAGAVSYEDLAQKYFYYAVTFIDTPKK